MLSPTTRLAPLLSLISLLAVGADTDRHGRINLQRLLEDPVALQKLKLDWEYPPDADLYLYGNGTVILQAYLVVSDDPDNPFVMKNRSGVVPTCRANVGTDDLRKLVRVMISNRFFDLPEKNYVYMTAAYGKPKLELHTIRLSDGTAQAERTFGVGEYQGRRESLPQEFVAVEDALRGIRDSAFPPSQRPCGVAPAIKFDK
jgi:hypothetical protein